MESRCVGHGPGVKHAGQDDAHNLFPEVVRAVRETQPKVFLVENVPQSKKPVQKDLGK
jgi:DNA (cytosine-5)-methyltransferase 1